MANWIYNSAIDNAAGVAVLLDIAAALSREGAQPRRSVLFAFFTAHEVTGELPGSKYFVDHPTVDRKSIAANINVDNVQVIVPLKAMLILGADESDMGDAVRRVAAAQKIELDVDSEPQGNRFTCCSDQRSFVAHGIPAVKVNVGFPGELRAMLQKWRQERYHTPSDDLQQAINLESVSKYEEFVRALLLDVANNPRPPEWKPNSFYRRYTAK